MSTVVITTENESRLQASTAVGLPWHPTVFGPAIADQLAALISRYWREALRHGEIDVDHEVDIIDLCPGDGQTGSMLCAALSRRLQGLDTLRCRYLAVVPEEQSLMQSHGAESSGRIAMQCLGWNILDATDQPKLQHDDRPYRVANPLVVLTHDAWSKLRQTLYGIHYGKLLRANLMTLAMSNTGKDSEQLWLPADTREWGEALAPLLKRYLHEFNSSPVVFPSAGIVLTEKIAALAGDQVLLVSMGDGHSDEKTLRLASFADIIGDYRESGRLPVNFQLMAAWMRARGGSVVDVDLSSGEILQLQLLCRTAPQERLQSVARCVDSALFSSGHHLVEVCKHLGPSVSLATRLNLLQMSRHDPKVFAAEAQQIVMAMSKGSDFNREDWHRSLESVWANHRIYPVEEALYRRIATVAMHCGHWGFARRVLADGMALLGENAEDIAHLAWCEIRTGNLSAGRQQIARALAMDGSSPLALEIDRRASSKALARDTQWLVELRDATEPLFLEPLDQSHADDYLRQYRDPQIAIMTGLPGLKTADEVRRWIAEQEKEAGRVNFAVMHRDWGFVGFINLAVSGHAAFFCFWTGVDFQGVGFATAAGRLACAHAAACGVPVMLTSAYKDNHRSMRALRRLGFEEMRIRACPPDQDRIFFSLIDASAGEVDTADELVNYYAREKLPMQFEGRQSEDLANADSHREVTS
jgi:RimJ/RimL family protein N-acetyltransferase